MSNGIRYAYDEAPGVGETIEVAPGVHWLRMPLPFRLDHINLWLLEDGDTWTAIDTGYNRQEVKDAWEQIFESTLDGRPIGRLICTHFHPDHMGLAGWLTERLGVDMWSTLGEWTFARMLSLDSSASFFDEAKRFFHAAGLENDSDAARHRERNNYQNATGPIPSRFHRLREGDVIDIGGHQWRVIIGTGHSPEHACLYCAGLNLLISGDQVLPKISPNISVWHSEPDADPLRLYLESLPKLRQLPAETLVLPSHNLPFVGLRQRIDELAHHHDDRLDKTLEVCANPQTGMEMVAHLFRPDLDKHQVVFALGESLAHLHLLMGQGRITRTARTDGVNLFTRTA